MFSKLVFGLRGLGRRAGSGRFARARLALLAVSGAALAVAMTGTAAAQIPGLPSGPFCGSTLTTSVTLTADITGCNDNGLKIDANNVTLDMNGHKLSGAGALIPNNGTGITITPGRRNITIRNGRIDGFRFAGIFADGLNTSRFDRLTVISNGANGIDLRGANINNSITAGNISRNGASGIAMTDANSNRITNSFANDNQGHGLLLNDSDRTTIDSSLFSGNRGSGVHLFRSANDNTITRNTFLHNDINGLNIFTSNNNFVQLNSSSGNVEIGIALIRSNSNQVLSNTVGGNLDDGIQLLESDGDVIQGNTLFGNQGDGIFIDKESDTASVIQNNSSRATDDGIQTDNASTTVRLNFTTDNADLGIQAVPGTRDGGGNRAINNGNNAKCTNVRCT